MSRSLSWIDPQELDALFAQMGVQEASPAKAGSAPHVPGEAAQTKPSAQELPETPFDKKAREVREHGVGAAIQAPAPPPDEPAIPTLLPMVDPGNQALLEAKIRWEAMGQLPIGDELSFPTCLEQFLSWLMTTTEGAAGFLADAQGLPFVQTAASQGEVGLSATFAWTEQLLGLWKPEADPALQHIIVPISQDESWHVGWCSSRVGRAAWGLKTSTVITLEIAQSISSMLETMLNHSAFFHATHRS